MDQTSSDNRTDQPFTIRKAETNEDLQEIAALADVIWHEHFTPIIGKEQVEYMLSRFQSYPAFTRSGSYRIRILPASRQPKTVRIYGDQAGSGRKDVFEQTVHCQTIPRQTFSRIFV